MTKKKRTYILEGVSVTFTSEIIDDKEFDTEVQVKGVYFCTIAGQDIQAFKDQFTNLLKLRI